MLLAREGDLEGALAKLRPLAETAGGAGGEEGIYWRYETLLKYYEGRNGCVLGPAVRARMSPQRTHPRGKGMDEETTVAVGPYTATITIKPDEYPEDPRDTGVLGAIHVFESGPEMGAKAKELFGRNFGPILDTMKSGDIAWKGNTPWIGLERYRLEIDGSAVVLAKIVAPCANTRAWKVFPLPPANWM